MESTEDSSNNNNSRNPKQPEADFGPSTSGNQTKQYKGSSRTFEMDELKSIIFCIKRQVKNPSHEEIKRAIEDPSLITFKRRPGEGLKPMFDRFRVGEINLALENDMVSSKRPNDSESLIQKRKRSVSRERSSSVGGRRRSRSTTPDRKQLASYGMLIPMMPWSYPLYPRHPSLMPPPMRSSLVYYSRTQAPSAATEAPTNLCVRNKDSNEAI